MPEKKPLSVGTKYEMLLATAQNRTYYNPGLARYYANRPIAR